MNEIAKTDAQEIMEAVLIKGDLSKLTPEERNLYYSETCKSLGLNPLTKPFDYLQLGGKLIMYAKRDAADQLRKIHGVNIEVLKQEAFEGLFCVTVRAVDKTGPHRRGHGLRRHADHWRRRNPRQLHIEGNHQGQAPRHAIDLRPWVPGRNGN